MAGGTPNPFMFGDQPQMNNQFMPGANPYNMAPGQQFAGYNQFGGMQPGYPGYPGYPGQPQQNMFGYNPQQAYGGQFGAAGGQMAQMNTNTYSVPSNAGAALFGVAPTTTAAEAADPGAALFGGGAADNPFAAPASDSPAAPLSAQLTGGSQSAAANPFADPSADSLGGSAVGTPGTQTPAPAVVSAVVPEVSAEVNPFADVSSQPQPPATLNTEPNPFSSADEPVNQATSDNAAAAENPFADVSNQPVTAVLNKQDSSLSVKSAQSDSNKQVVDEDNKELVQQVVGGLDESAADMMDKVDTAKTPVTARKKSASESESESESETESEGGDKEEKSDDDEEEIKPKEVVANDDEDDEVTPPAKEEKVVAKEKSDTESDDDDDEVKSPPVVERKEVVDEESESDEETPAPAPAPGLMTGGTAAGLFDAAPVTGTAANIFSSDSEPVKPGLSTGHAIFTDAPAVPDIQSTGAAIFGIDDGSAAGSTGAAIFDIQAPTAQPCHGEMSGWDEAFDKKFDTASTAVMNPSVALDAFGTVAQATPFGYPPPDQDDTAFCDSFGMASLEADLNNPFKSDGLPGPGEKSADGESPLFEADTSRPLDSWPGITYDGDGWEMFIRHPPKKKITAQRYWKKVWVRIVMQADTPAVLLFNHKDDKDPIQELPLQAAYSLSEISHQVFDQFTKVFTIKLQYIFYKERAGIRPGQVSKMQVLTNKIGALAKAVEDADLKGVKHFASDMKKLGVPLEHAPQISELLKLASFNYEDMKTFSSIIEEKLFRVEVNRDKALTYKTEECQLTAVEEVLVDQDQDGHVSRKICRVRVFFLSFLTGMPTVDLGVNDMTRIGKEVVGRHDILPVPTEQWIRYEDIEFHNVVDKKAFEAEDHVVKFQPPDACYIEVMRFRCRPPRARELPVQARCSFSIINNKVEIRSDVMVPYHATKAWGQVPCEDVQIRIPIPEAWVYQFRSEKLDMTMGKVTKDLKYF